MKEKTRRPIRQWGCLAGVVILLIVLLMVAWISRDAVPPMRYVPSDSPLVLRLTGLYGLWGQIESHPCIKGLPPKAKEWINSQLSFVKDLPEPLSPLDREKVGKVIGREVMLILPDSQGKTAVVATRVHPLLKIVEWGARKAGKIQFEQVEGWPVRSVDLDKGQKLHFVLTSRTFFGSTDRSALLKCLATKTPLEKDASYLAAKEKLKPGDGLEAMFRVDRLAPGWSKAVVRPGQTFLALEMGKDGDLHLRGTATIEGDKKALLNQVKPGPVAGFSSLPRESLIVLASDWSKPMSEALGLLSELSGLKALDPKNLDPNYMNMASVLGYDLQGDFIDAAQEEMILVFDDLDVNEVMPMPELAILLKSSKPGNGSDVLGRALKDVVLGMDLVPIQENMRPFVQIEERQVADHKAFVMSNAPFGKSFKPCLSWAGDYVVLSTSEETLERLIRNDVQGSRLSDRSEYGELLKGESNLSVFVNVRGILERIESLGAEWARLGLLKDTDEAKFNDEILPLYDAMESVDSFLLNVCVKDGSFDLQGKIHLAPANANSKP